MKEITTVPLREAARPQVPTHTEPRPQEVDPIPPKPPTPLPRAERWAHGIAMLMKVISFAATTLVSLVFDWSIGKVAASAVAVGTFVGTLLGVELPAPVTAIIYQGSIAAFLFLSRAPRDIDGDGDIDDEDTKLWRGGAYKDDLSG